MMRRVLAMAAITGLLSAAACSSGDKADDDTQAKSQQSALPFEVQDNAEARRVNTGSGDGASNSPVFALSPDGLVITHGDAKGQPVTLLQFGDGQEEVIDALSRDLGKPRESDNKGCSEGAMHFADFGELRAAFSDGKFVGWHAEQGKGLPTGDGIGPGQSFRLLEKIGAKMVADSDVDGEFVLAGSPYGKGMGGILGENEKVLSLHAGENCF